MYAATKHNRSKKNYRTSSFCAVNASSTVRSIQAQSIQRSNLSHIKIYRISLITGLRAMRMPALPVSGVESYVSLRRLVKLVLKVQRLNHRVVRQTFDAIASYYDVLALASVHDGVHLADPRSAVVHAAVSVSVSSKFRGRVLDPAIANGATQSTVYSLAGFIPTSESGSGEIVVTAGCALQFIWPIDGYSCCARAERVNDSFEIWQAGGKDGEVEHDLGVDCGRYGVPGRISGVFVDGI